MSTNHSDAADTLNQLNKILSILDSGHEVEMWHCDDEHTRENVNPGEPVRIHLRAVEDGDDVDNGTAAVEYRTRGGEVVGERGVTGGQIEVLVSGRSWTVDKKH